MNIEIELLLTKNDYETIKMLIDNMKQLYERSYDENIRRIHEKDFKKFSEEDLVEENNFLLEQIVNTKALLSKIENNAKEIERI